MSAVIVPFLAAAAVIVLAGTALTRFADVIADLTGWGRMLVGMVLLAAATSLPELAVDISAVRLGAPNLAVGDLMGSSLFNLLILAVADLLHRSPGGMFTRVAAGHALSGTMSISLTALVALGIVLGQRLGGGTFLGVGVVPWIVAAVFLMGVRIVFYDQRAAADQASRTAGPAPTTPPHSRWKLWQAVIGFAISAAVILVTGPFMARAADRLAEESGLGGTFVGTTFVAISTSLPELVATIVAVRMGAFDLAVGNIFGSNSFNMALLVPLDIAYPGSLLASVSPTHLTTCLSVVLVTSVAIIGQLYHVERRKRILEPDAALVVLLVIASLVLVYFTS